MLEDNFFLEIRGQKVRINEPLDFSSIEFVAKQNSDGFMGRNKVVAGEKQKLKFTSWRHENVFEELLYEKETYGYNAEIYFYFGNMKMRLDMETATTDGFKYLECQALEDSLIHQLDYNKDVKIDLNNELNVLGGAAPKAKLYRTYISSASIESKSQYKSNRQEILPVGGGADNTDAMFNIVAQIQKSEIKNTLVPFFGSINFYNTNRINRFKFLDLQDNFSSIDVDYLLNVDIDYYQSNITEFKLVLHLMNVDNTISSTYTLFDALSEGKPSSVNRQLNTVTLNNVTRGQYVAIFWKVKGRIQSAPYNFGRMTDKGCVIDFKGSFTTFGSIATSARYYDVIENVLHKISTKPINITFEDSSFSDFFFTGNQVRFGDDMPCIVTWKDIEEQLTERGLGYEVVGDTINFRSIGYFYNNIKSVEFLSGEDTSVFTIDEDSEKNVNTLIYKYKKFQALKEVPIEGNAGTTNGDSEWYIQNRFTDKKLTIDLPIARDRFLLENTRKESLAFNENTKTNDDDTGYLFTGTTQNYFVEETAFMSSRFDDETLIQSFVLTDTNIGWTKLGVRVGSIINFDINGNKEYLVQNISGGVIDLTRVNHLTESNETKLFSFSFSSGSDYYIDLKISNNNRTIRQNIEVMRELLSIYNFYTVTPITNTVYKENKEFSFNGIKEVDPIHKLVPRIKPKIITAKCVDDYGKLEEFLQNRNGFVTLHTAKGGKVDVYVKELSQSMKVNECGKCEYNITGEIRN